MKILKKTYALLYLVIACASPALCFQKPDVLTIAHSEVYAPYSFINNKGESEGMLIDLWNEFGRLNNVKIHFRPASWSQTISLVRSKEADLHSGLFLSRERSAYLDFSDSLGIPVTTRLFVSHKLKASNIEDLKSVKIGVVRGDFTETYLTRRYPGFNTHKYSTGREMVKAAIRGDVLAFLSDYPTAMYNLHKEGAPDIFSVRQKIYQKSLHSATAIGNTEVLEFVNKGLKKIPESEFDRITNKWIRPEPKIPHWVPYIFTVTLLTFITLLSAMYVYTLRKNKIRLRILVNKRTRDLRQRNRELRQKNKELNTALKEVKLLSGILPICSSCKKIRETEGYWTQVEDYIASHSEAQFTHGICESCEIKLYGKEKWYKNLVEERDS